MFYIIKFLFFCKILIIKYLKNFLKKVKKFSPKNFIKTEKIPFY